MREQSRLDQAGTAEGRSDGGLVFARTKEARGNFWYARKKKSVETRDESENDDKKKNENKA